MEILAPAGSIAALKAAIKGGANAVYLGLGEHNARVKSNDFSTDNLAEWVGYSHLFGVKVYVTLNTAVKEEEISRVLSLAKVAADAGADALIVSDLGIVKILSEISDIPLHLSTQAGGQNSLDIEALKAFRIKRIILAREVPISDLSEIKKKANEIEIFAQGAICVAFSGGCLLGSKIYGASGNRGLCNQACRLTYTASDESGRVLKKGKLISPSDLSLGKGVLELAGKVDSIKIEGRLKRPLYVYAATKYYRDILNGADERAAFRELSESFNRGFVKGYTLNKSAKIVNPLTSSHLGVSVGKILSLQERGGYPYAVVRSSYPFSKGDGAKILRNGVEVGGSDITSVQKIGRDYLIPISAGVKIGDEVRLTTNCRKVLEAERLENYLPIRIRLEGRIGEPLRISAMYGEFLAAISSDSLAEKAQSSDNRALTEKLSKLGGTDFVLSELQDLCDEALYIPVSELNRMRRDVLRMLRTAIIEARHPRYRVDLNGFHPGKLPSKRRAERLLEVSSAEELKDFVADRYIITADRFDQREMEKLLRSSSPKKCYLRLPKIAREKELPLLIDFLKEFPELGIYADNLYAITIARNLGRGYIAGFGLNVYSEETAACYADADFVCASIEYPHYGNLIYRAGKVPLMSFAHCPFSVAYGTSCASCDKARSRLIYQSADARYLILRRESASCDFTMYEDRVTRYPLSAGEKSSFYSLIGLNEEEKRDMMKYISEDCGE